jgi:hypothetical protein
MGVLKLLRDSVHTGQVDQASMVDLCEVLKL